MSRPEKNTVAKIKLFRSLFSGLSNVYGTYDPKSGRSKQIKATVTDKVIFTHLTGRNPYGVYLLKKDRTCAIVADFDSENRLPPIEFVSLAKHYGIKAYIERSKSKGYHVWIFFENDGVLAYKARLVVHHILEEIGYPSTEVFPKQDRLDESAQFGNFINAPLFGALVPKGKTVFVDPHTFESYANQWEFLGSVKKNSESVLDDIIELRDLPRELMNHLKRPTFEKNSTNSYGLPACAQKMLNNGVKQYQRVSCFRLSVHLKRLGLPYDLAVTALKVWAQKNQPKGGKQIITELEIIEQASYAFKKEYRGYGCSSIAVAPFCDQNCPVKILKAQK